MSIFAVSDYESEVQIGDKTRFDASKSFAAKGTTEITELTIKVGEDASAVSVWNSDQSDWYQDWVFTDFKLDVDSSNAVVKFKVNGTEYTGTVASGSYTLSQYATAVETAMNAAFSNSFAITFLNDIATITGTNSFQLVSSAVVSQLFLDTEPTQASHTGSVIEYGKRIVTTVCTNAIPLSSTHKAYVKVFSESGDKLFCSDQDLVAHEADIMKWVPAGRASHKNVYRRAQKMILAWLDQNGYVNVFNEKFTKQDIIDIEEVREWATFMSLRLIFEGIKNSTDDVFSEKAKTYGQLEAAARQRVILRIDIDKDGIADATEGPSIYSGSLFRR